MTENAKPAPKARKPRRKNNKKPKQKRRQAKPKQMTLKANGGQDHEKLIIAAQKVNPYERMLLDNTCDELIGLPDAYPHPTAKIRMKTIVTLPWTGGKTSAIIGRSLENFVEVPGSVTRQAATGGLSALANGGNIHLVNSRGHNVGYTSPTEAYVFPCDQSGDPHFFDALGTPEQSIGFRLGPCNAGDVFYCTFPSTDVTANAWALTLTSYDSAGTTVNTVGTPVAGNGTYIAAQVTAPAGAVSWDQVTLDRIAGAGALTNPGSPNVEAAFSHATTSGPKRYPIGMPDGSELATILTAKGKYRMLAMQVLAQYRGSALSNGKIAIGQVPVSDLHQIPATTVSALSLIPGFYNGALNKGGYCWHRPLGLGDTIFQDMGDNTDDDGSLICIAAEANSADAEYLALICNLVIEVQTQNQVFATTSNPVNPPMIWQAHANLSHFPNAMENPLHLGAIAKKLWGDVKHASRAVAEFVRDWGPLLTEMAEFALAV